MFTVIEAALAPLLHAKVPVKPLAVSVEVPQLSATLIEGIAGIGFTVTATALEVAEQLPLVTSVE